jgi:hypothetical protein
MWGNVNFGSPLAAALGTHSHSAASTTDRVVVMHIEGSDR